jgi:hypothetical protein
MLGANMKLTHKQQEKLKKFLNEKWSEPCCTVCGKDTLEFSDTLFKLNEVNPDGPLMGEMPVIALVCNNCGNIILFNAIVLGVARELE